MRVLVVDKDTIGIHKTNDLIGGKYFRVCGFRRLLGGQQRRFGGAQQTTHLCSGGFAQWCFVVHHTKTAWSSSKHIVTIINTPGKPFSRSAHTNLGQAPVGSKPQRVGGIQQPLEPIRALGNRPPPRGNGGRANRFNVGGRSSRGAQGGGDVGTTDQLIGRCGPACVLSRSTACSCAP